LEVWRTAAVTDFLSKQAFPQPMWAEWFSQLNSWDSSASGVDPEEAGRTLGLYETDLNPGWRMVWRGNFRPKRATCPRSEHLFLKASSSTKLLLPFHLLHDRILISSLHFLRKNHEEHKINI
jgi:hypothetical protein